MSFYAELKHAEEARSLTAYETAEWYEANVEVEAIKSAMRLEAQMEEAAERATNEGATDEHY